MYSFSYFLNLLAELELIMSFGRSFQIFIYLYQEIRVFDHIFLIIVPLFRTLPGALSCKIMAAASNFFRFTVAILFGYIGSRNL